MCLKNMIKLEFKNLISRSEFFISFTLMLLFSIISVVINASDIYGKSIDNVISASDLFMINSHSGRILSGMIIMVLLPVIASVPFSDSYYIDKKSGIYLSVLTRTSQLNYIFSKAIVTFLSAFIVLFIPLLLNQILCLIMGPVSSFCDLSGWPAYETSRLNEHIYFWTNFENNTYVMNFIYILWASIFGGFMALFSFAFSFLTEKRVLIITIGTIIYSISNFLLSLLNLDNWVFATYLDVTKSERWNFNSFIIIHILLLSFIVGVLIKKNFINKEVWN